MSLYLGEPGTRPGIAGTAYDTAWIATVPAEGDQRTPRFPSALQWLLDHQLPDGSWGGEVRYEHDRILCTLAALAPLAHFGRRVEDRAAVEAGTRYLWQHGHLLATEPVELVGFELLLPTLVSRAVAAGIAVPPHLDVYAAQRAEKLRLIPSAALYSTQTTAAHSLEFLGDEADRNRLKAAQGANGAVGNSPAATAFYLTKTSSNDPLALRYLQDVLDRNGGAVAPVLYPCETFELLWAAYHLYVAGVSPERLLTDAERLLLRKGLQRGGVSLSPTFPVADADDTAVALLLLHDLGEQVDPSVLSAFASPRGYFASFPHERHSSVGVNLHVLHAIARVPGYPEVDETIDRLLDYLEAEQVRGLYWLDKWHISPYYATAHALFILPALATGRRRARVHAMVERAREWIRQTQNPDGSWGFYGQPTAEESAYCVLALSRAPSNDPITTVADGMRAAAGLAFLRDQAAAEAEYPPLWIDKCLYTPTLVVRAVIEAASLAHARVGSYPASAATAQVPLLGGCP